MKRVVDVRIGTQEIVRIYKGDTLIWDKHPPVKVIIGGSGDVQIEPTASGETRYCSDATMFGTFNESAVANANVIIPRVTALCAEDIDVVGSGESVVPTPERSVEIIRIGTCASPTTKVAIANSISKIVINGIGSAKSSDVTPIATVSKIDVDEVAYARSAPANDANSYDSIDMSERAYAISNLYHYADSHSRIRIDGTYTGDSILANDSNSHSSISVDTNISAPDSQVLDASAHGDIGTGNMSSGDKIEPTSASMRVLVDVDGKLQSSSEFVDGAAYDYIRTYAISQARHTDTHATQSNSVIDTDSNANAILWTYPVLHGDTLTIIQAHKTDDDNLPNLIIMQHISIYMLKQKQ